MRAHSLEAKKLQKRVNELRVQLAERCSEARSLRELLSSRPAPSAVAVAPPQVRVMTLLIHEEAAEAFHDETRRRVAPPPAASFVEFYPRFSQGEAATMITAAARGHLARKRLKEELAAAAAQQSPFILQVGKS